MVDTLFMKHPVASTVGGCVALQFKLHKRKKVGTVTSYCEAVRYLFEKYDTDDTIAKTDACMMCFKQPSSKPSMEYDEALWNKELRC